MNIDRNLLMFATVAVALARFGVLLWRAIQREWQLRNTPEGKALRAELLPAACVVVVAAGLLFAFRGFALSSPPKHPPAPQSEFLPVDGHIRIGTKFYVNHSKHYLGTVVEIEGQHEFGDGTIREGVRVLFPDGVKLWVPISATRLIYVVKASEIASR